MEYVKVRLFREVSEVFDWNSGYEGEQAGYQKGSEEIKNHERDYPSTYADNIHRKPNIPIDGTTPILDIAALSMRGAAAPIV